MSEERRRYFRIEDFIDVTFSVSRDEPALPTLKVVAPTSFEDYKSSDQEFNTIVNTLWSDHPKMAKALGLLNRKIDIIANEMNVFSESEDYEDYDFHYNNVPVNLSGCGMAFYCEPSLNKSDRLDMLLTLKPANTKIKAQGKIIDVEKNPAEIDMPYRIRLEFQLDVMEEELLIQHIVQRQLQLRKNINAYND